MFNSYDTLAAMRKTIDEQRRASIAPITRELEPRVPFKPPAGPPSRRLVSKATIISRLNTAGLLKVAAQALSANLYTHERWYCPGKPAVYFDDPEALALLKTIGADPAVILAEDTQA